jgi:hypothetical protein
VGKAARRRRQGAARQGAAVPRSRRADGGSQSDDPRARAQAAVTRLVRTNPPGKVSLAGAYALGFAALGMAQAEGDEPEWFAELDPLDTLFLGTVWPRRLADGYEFGNALTAWLGLLRGTVHWTGDRAVRPGGAGRQRRA